MEGLSKKIHPWDYYQSQKKSAVLFLFIPDEFNTDTASLVLTKRSTSLRSHKGQIGCPGGHWEDHDHDPAATAIREANEELGLPIDHVVVHGCLEPVHSLEGHPVIPVVATSTTSLGELRPNSDEVAEVLPCPWIDLAHHRDIPFEFNLFGYRRKSHRFVSRGSNIWGLTAKMIHNAGMREHVNIG